MISNNKEEITPEASKRICSHLNEDHGITIYAMALRVATIKSGWKLTDARVSEISLSGCILQAFICQGDMCEMLRVPYPFVPPVRSSAQAQVRKRMVAIHNQVLSPRFVWFVTKPMVFCVTLIVGAIAYSLLVLGIPKSVETLESSEILSVPITNMFGSASNFMEVIQYMFCVLVVGHMAQAAYVVYHCQTTLKLGLSAQLQWAFMILIDGIFILKEFFVISKVAWSKSANKKGE